MPVLAQKNPMGRSTRLHGEKVPNNMGGVHILGVLRSAPQGSVEEEECRRAAQDDRTREYCLASSKVAPCKKSQALRMTERERSSKEAAMF